VGGLVEISLLIMVSIAPEIGSMKEIISPVVLTTRLKYGDGMESC